MPLLVGPDSKPARWPGCTCDTSSIAVLSKSHKPEFTKKKMKKNILASQKIDSPVWIEDNLFRVMIPGPATQCQKQFSRLLLAATE